MNFLLPLSFSSLLALFLSKALSPFPPLAQVHHFLLLCLKKLCCRGSEMNKNVILNVPIVHSHLFLLYRFISRGKLLAGREDASQNDIYFIVQGGSPACFHVTQILEP